MNRLESLGFIKWRVIAVLLIITLTIQLIPSRFADLIRSKVCASEESVFYGNEYPDLIPEVSIEEDNTDISKDKKGLSVNGELTDLRSRHSKTYRLSDGSFYSTQFSYPIHIIEDDRWIDVDNTLISDPDCGRVWAQSGFPAAFLQFLDSPFRGGSNRAPPPSSPRPGRLRLAPVRPREGRRAPSRPPS